MDVGHCCASHCCGKRLDWVPKPGGATGESVFTDALGVDCEEDTVVVVVAVVGRLRAAEPETTREKKKK